MAVPDGAAAVPDDPSALEPDRVAWLAEQRRLRRRRRLRRLVLTRRWERFGLSGPLVVLCLLATGAVGALAVVLVPHPPRPAPAPAPLAAAPRIAVAATGSTPARGPASVLPSVEGPGAILGHRLPDVALAADVRSVRADDLRPAMVLLVPPACGCADAVGALYRQAREFRVSVWLVAAAGPDDAGTAAVRRDLHDLDATTTAGGARWAVDADAVLLRAVLSQGLTVVLVRPDGVVSDVRRDVGATRDDVPAMEIALAGLVPRR